VSPLNSPFVATLSATGAARRRFDYCHEKMTESVSSTYDPSDDREHERYRCEP
jgi:hypothetical protein